MIINKNLFQCVETLSKVATVTNEMINDATPDIDELFGSISEHINVLIRKVKNFTREIFIIERYITCEKARELYSNAEEIPEDIKNQIIKYRDEDDLCLFTLEPCTCDKDAKKLLEKMNDFLQDMGKRREKSTHLSKNILDSLNTIKNKFESFSSNITKIVEIAEKVDLVAINAYVEAARMGNDGKGFEIIAANIRKAAIEIQNLGKEINMQFGDLEESLNKNNSIFKHYREYENESKINDDLATKIIKEEIMNIINNFVEFITFTSNFSMDIFEEINTIQSNLISKLQFVDIDNQKIQNIGKKLSVTIEMIRSLLDYFSDKLTENELLEKFSNLENRFMKIATVFREAEITSENMEYDLTNHTEVVGEKFEEAEGDVELF